MIFEFELCEHRVVSHHSRPFRTYIPTFKLQAHRLPCRTCAATHHRCWYHARTDWVLRFFKGWARFLTGFNSYYDETCWVPVPPPSNSYVLALLVRHPPALGAAVFSRSVEGCMACTLCQGDVLRFVYWWSSPLYIAPIE